MRSFKLFIGLFFCILLAFGSEVSAVTLKKAISDDKPFIMMIYAEWSDYSDVYDNLKKLKPLYPQYNFVKVNVASEDAKYIFQDKRFIVSEMPMVIVAKKGGRINKAIPNACANDIDCVAKILKHF